MIKHIFLTSNTIVKRIYQIIVNNFKCKCFFIIFLIVKIQIFFYFYTKYNNNYLSFTNDESAVKEWIETIPKVKLIYPSVENSSGIIDEWQYLGDPYLRYQLYSAYFDSRLELYKKYYDDYVDDIPLGAIRIIAVFPLKMKGKLMNCHYKYNNYIKMVPAIDVVPISENYGLEFSAFFINCHLSASNSSKSVELPEAVALTFAEVKSMQLPETFIKIRYPIDDNILKSNDISLAVCVPPAHNNYSQALRIVEFVEIYKILGVQKFYFYDKSITSAVHDVMEYYRIRNVAEILKWNFNGYAFEKDIRYEGIFAALNDCLYRATFVDGYQYVTVVDFDEILIPMQQFTLIDFIKEYNNVDIYMYLFRCVLLYSTFENDNVEIDPQIENKFLYTQMKIKRTCPLADNTRTKYIAKGVNCIELGNHFVWKYLQFKSKFKVFPSNGLLYHYRDEVLNDISINELISDKSVQMYGELLWPIVDEICHEIFPNGLCPIN